MSIMHVASMSTGKDSVATALLMLQTQPREQCRIVFADPDRDAHLNKRGIRKVVEWSKTKRGGVLMDFIRINEEPAECSSSHGLCE